MKVNSPWSIRTNKQWLQFWTTVSQYFQFDIGRSTIECLEYFVGININITTRFTNNRFSAILCKITGNNILTESHSTSRNTCKTWSRGGRRYI